MSEVIERLAMVPNEYDLVEIWINEIQDLDIDVLKEKTKKLLIIKITDVTDKELLEKIGKAGFNYLDVDFKDLEMFKEFKVACKIIGSYHDYEGTPTLEKAREIAEKIYDSGADIAKIVFYAKTCEDSFIPINLLKEAKKPMISFCMGHKGRISRFLGVQCGSLINYIAPDESWKTAEGQFTLDDWNKIQTVLYR
jgi:3-dehydroquinate dehydratase type I